MKNLLIYDEDIINKRWSECEECEHLIRATNQCNVCKCMMKLKTRVSNAKCPVGKWDKYAT